MNTADRTPEYTLTALPTGAPPPETRTNGYLWAAWYCRPSSALNQYRFGHDEIRDAAETIAAELRNPPSGQCLAHRETLAWALNSCRRILAR